MGLDAVRRRFRHLAKVWHPDRFAADPAGQAEAGVEMRRLNAAYRCLLEAAGRNPAALEAKPGSPREAGDGGPSGRRLTPDEIDAMVAAVGAASWIEWLVDATPGGPSMARLLEWLTTRRPLGSWRLLPGIAMLGVLALGYAVLGVATFSGIAVRGSALEVVVGGCMMAGIAAAAYLLRERE